MFLLLTKASSMMDRKQYPQCRITSFEDGHSYFLKEKPHENFSEFDLLKLEELADKLEEAAKANEECRIDWVRHSTTEIKQILSCDLPKINALACDVNSSKFRVSEKNELINSSECTLSFRQHGAKILPMSSFSNLVHADGSFYSSENIHSENNNTNSFDIQSYLNPTESPGDGLTYEVEKEWQLFEQFSKERNYQYADMRLVSQEVDETVCSEASFGNFCKKEVDSSEIADEIERNSTESKGVSDIYQAAGNFALVCSERNEDTFEALNPRDCKNLRWSAAEPISVDSCVGGEFANDDNETLILVADAANVSNPSEINIKPQKKDKEKPFVCEVCNMRFSRKTSLQSHSRTHTGEKPFFCHKCDKKFARKGSLVYHISGHNGEKKFTCDICHKHFRKKQNFLDHTLAHRGEKPFECIICGIKFSCKYSFNRHYKRIHQKI